MWGHTHTPSCTHTMSPCTHVGTHTHTHPNFTVVRGTHTHTRSCTHNVQMYICGGMRLHAHTHMRSCTPCPHVYMWGHTHNVPMYTRGGTHAHTHTRAHAHTQCPHVYMSGYTHTHSTTDRHGRLQAVHVMTTVTLITQQHFLGIALAATDTAASQQGRAVPLDALVQRSQVKEDLGQAGAAQHRLFPALVDHPPPMLLVWRVWGQGKWNDQWGGIMQRLKDRVETDTEKNQTMNIFAVRKKRVR